MRTEYLEYEDDDGEEWLGFFIVLPWEDELVEEDLEEYE